MANLPESATYDAGVYQLETTDAVVGGVSGKSNASAINLANRTKYLKAHVDIMETIVPQNEAEARTATTLRGWTAQRVGQAIAAGITALVVQATETVKGILEIATQAETEAGSSDEVAVTPLKLCAGFSISFSQLGHIKFPNFLGGLIIQWGSSSNITGGSHADVTYSTAYPNACLGAVVSSDRLVDSTTSCSYGWENLSNSQIRIRNASTVTTAGWFISIGH
jgi:hypothetical protein